MISRFALAAIVVTFLNGRDGSAQMVPLLAGELSVGHGPASEHAGDQWYRKPPAPMVRAGLAVRLGGAGHLRPVILLEHSFQLGGHAVPAVCYMSPSGRCRGEFPETTGHSIGLGVRRTLGWRGLLGVGAGAGWYERPVHFAEVDASWRIVSRLAVMTELRHIYFSVDSHRVWSRPLSFGVRVTW